MTATFAVRTARYKQRKRRTTKMAEKTVVSGSTVTVGQLKDLFRQIADGSIGFEEMEATLTHQFENTLHAVIAACNLDWVNPNIEKHFTLEPVRKERKAFHFGCNISSDEAERHMKAEGWNPANLAELIAYAKDEWNGKDWVVALGSSAQFDGLCHVPILCRHSAERDLNLYWRGRVWSRYSRFLAARN